VNNRADIPLAWQLTPPDGRLLLPPDTNIVDKVERSPWSAYNAAQLQVWTKVTLEPIALSMVEAIRAYSAGCEEAGGWPDVIRCVRQLYSTDARFWSWQLQKLLCGIALSPLWSYHC